jgi:hypothetical protein
VKQTARDPHAVQTVRAHPLDPQLAAAALPERHRIHRQRRNFGLVFAAGAEDYAPDPYHQRIAES